MNDFKNFLKNNKVVSDVITSAHEFRAVMKGQKRKDYIGIYNLGLFFWDRGGKQFALNYKETFNDDIVKDIKFCANEVIENNTNTKRDYFIARDFLDALACLGEEKIKELIKDMEKVVRK